MAVSGRENVFQLETFCDYRAIVTGVQRRVVSRFVDIQKKEKKKSLRGAGTYGEFWKPEDIPHIHVYQHAHDQERVIAT